MTHEPMLFVLGLARKAGKLAYGELTVREACAQKKARVVLIANDAGETTAWRGTQCAQRAGIVYLTLPFGKALLGNAIGCAGCALCAVTDMGLANAAVQKLVGTHPQYSEQARALEQKNARIAVRRGKKKRKTAQTRPLTKAEQTTASHREIRGCATDDVQSSKRQQRRGRAAVYPGVRRGERSVHGAKRIQNNRAHSTPS